MNPLSSIPPTPPRDASSSPLTEPVLPSHDASSAVSAIPSDHARKDTVSLSTPTQEISYYLERMSQIPDIREARIADIQKAIDSQTYSISPEKLADSLIQELHSEPQETRPPTTS